MVFWFGRRDVEQIVEERKFEKENSKLCVWVVGRESLGVWVFYYVR